MRRMERDDIGTLGIGENSFCWGNGVPQCWWQWQWLVPSACLGWAAMDVATRHSTLGGDGPGQGICAALGLRPTPTHWLGFGLAIASTNGKAMAMGRVIPPNPLWTLQGTPINYCRGQCWPMDCCWCCWRWSRAGAGREERWPICSPIGWGLSLRGNGKRVIHWMVWALGMGNGLADGMNGNFRSHFLPSFFLIHMEARRDRRMCC